MTIHLHRPVQRGFTLIEALIAFVVLTVGILGALLFHSTLIKESGESKARIEAIKLAERLIETQRGNTIYGSEAAFLAALPSGAQTSINGTNASFAPVWTSPEAVSGANGVYKQTLTLSWGDSTEAISVSTFFSWMNSEATLPADNAGAGGTGYAGNIPLPTGTLTAIERLEVVSDQSAEFQAGTEIRDGIQRYEDADGKQIIAVEVEDGKWVRLAELSEVDNEIMTISGKIYNSWDTSTDRRVDLKFRPVYRAADGTYEDEIIDIRATGGANCLIGKFSNDSDDKGIEATYLCVAGTGWNGTIYPYYRVLDGSSLKEIDIQEVQGVDAMVCAPRQRSYRYFTITVNTEDGLNALEEAIENGSAGSTAISTILENVGASVAGQSGLVRFYTTASEASASSEGVYWGDYFWHNPDYIVSPAAQSNLIAGASTAIDGYQVPLFASSATSTYSSNYPGDIAYQNFYLAVPTVGSGNNAVTWDCDDVVSNALASFASSASGSFLDSSYKLEHGMPGYKSNSAAAQERGYMPSIPVSNAYSVDDYNDFDWMVERSGNTDTYTPDFRGSIVLGYALATKSISGKLIYPSEMSSGTFTMAGNPEPVVSIKCTISSNQTLRSDGYERTYSCGVPANWTGNILAYYTPAENFYACSSAILSPAVSTAQITENLSDSDSIWSNLQQPELWPGVIYYVINEVSSVSTPSVSSSTIQAMGIHSYSQVNESKIDENFVFKTDSSAVSPVCEVTSM